MIKVVLSCQFFVSSNPRLVKIYVVFSNKIVLKCCIIVLRLLEKLYYVVSILNKIINL